MYAPFCIHAQKQNKIEEQNQLQLIKSLNVIHFAAWGGTHGDNTAAVSDAYNMLAAFRTSQTC